MDKGGIILFIDFLQNIFLFGYITGNHNFPKPLTTEEELEIIKRLKIGDEDARNILIERNLRLVAHIVKKFSNHSNEIEDLISVGTIGLIKSINSFDPDKGAKFATFASRCIHNAMVTLWKHLYIIIFNLLAKQYYICICTIPNN